MSYFRSFALLAIHQRPCNACYFGLVLRHHRNLSFSIRKNAKGQSQLNSKEAYSGLKETFVRTARFDLPLIINPIRGQTHVFDMNVVYMDTAVANSKGTVLLVHGVPGNFRMFEGIARPMVERGYRVVIPHFPGFSGTHFVDGRDERLFHHTTENKSMFLSTFIDRLDLHREIVLIVAHSAGTYPTMHYITTSAKINSAAKNKALVLLNPTVHRPFRALPNPFLLAFLTTCWKQPALRTVVEGILRRLASYLKIRYDNIDLLAIAVMTAVKINFEQINQCATALRVSDWQILTTISENDEYIESHLSRDFLRILGVDPHHILRYDNHLQLQSTGYRHDLTTNRRALVFSHGCHFSHQQHPSVVAPEILKMLPTK